LHRWRREADQAGRNIKRIVVASVQLTIKSKRSSA